MSLEQVRIKSLRCLSDATVQLDPEHNYVYGLNGAGKTSFLEALYLLSRGRSFRTRQTRKLIQNGAEGLLVFGETLAGDGVRHRIGVELDSTGRSMSVDKLRTESAAILAVLVRVDVIDPSIHRLIEGGPSERRRFLDWGAFHVEQNFLDAWRRYRRALGQRNAILKQSSSVAGSLNVWDQALVDAAGVVDAARAAHAEQLIPIVDEVGRELLGKAVSIQYFPGWRADLDLAAALRQSRDRDWQSGFTQVGPHRADLRLRLDGRGLAERASRGQQKLAAAALIIAQVRALAKSQSEGRGASSLLLVDDPAAELDQGSLARLLEVLRETPGQRVFTALSPNQLPASPDSSVFHVEQGIFEQMV